MNKSLRLHQKETYAKKQARIAKIHNVKTVSSKHLKMSAMSCGDSNCAMCGNPRKFFSDLTIQEKRFNQNNENF